MSLGHLTTIPKIQADVVWGSGYIEASCLDWEGSFPDNGTAVSDEVLEELYKELPRLYGALSEALRRRKPRDEN